MKSTIKHKTSIAAESGFAMLILMVMMTAWCGKHFTTIVTYINNVSMFGQVMDIPPSYTVKGCTTIVLVIFSLWEVMTGYFKLIMG